MRLAVLHEIPDDLELRREWNDLGLREESPQVFYTHEWALAVQRAYRETIQPVLFLGYEGESLCGLAALATDASRNQLSFLCATTGDYCDFLGAREHKADFVSAVLTEARRLGFRRITLTNLPSDSLTASVLRDIGLQNGYHLFARQAYECAQISMSRMERQAGTNKPRLPRAKMLRHSLEEMGRGGPVRLEHARSWDDAAPLLPLFIEAHVARFLAMGRISNLARRERQMFLTELTKLLAESGALKLSRMMSGEKVIAWNYGFQFAGTWFWYQPTFDSEYAKLSPGFCMLAKIVEEAAETPGVKVVDLGLGAEEYKERFSNQTRETLYVTLRTTRMQHVREIFRWRAACFVKSYPRLEATVRAAAQRARQLRAKVA